MKKSLPDEKYSAEPFREILRNTAVKPNDGDKKIYVFEDCDDMQPLLHNTLLKLIEEPQEHLRFIFTAENTASIPETVMSRVTEYPVPDPTIPDCIRCLTDSGADPRKSAELAELFSGNIGKCRMILSGADDKETEAELSAIESARRAGEALGNRNLFLVAGALSEQTKRAQFTETFRVFSRILRDALAISYGNEPESLAKEQSRKIARAYSSEQILQMLDASFEIEQNAIYNLNLALTVAYFMSRAFDKQ